MLAFCCVYLIGGELTVNLGEVAPVVPPHGGGEESNALVDPAPSSKLGPVRVEDHLVGASLFNADPEVRVALLQAKLDRWAFLGLWSYTGVEVEYEEQTCSLKHNHFVAFVLQTDVGLG